MRSAGNAARDTRVHVHLGRGVEQLQSELELFVERLAGLLHRVVVCGEAEFVKNGTGSEQGEKVSI